MCASVYKSVANTRFSVKFFGDTLNRINVAGCLIVFSGVVLFKVTHHLAKNHKGEQYRPVDELQNNDEEASGLWMTNVPVKLLQNADKLSFEMESLGIQMEISGERQEDDDENDCSSEHEQITKSTQNVSPVSRRACFDSTHRRVFEKGKDNARHPELDESENNTN
jgi:hypothetical protein